MKRKLNGILKITILVFTIGITFYFWKLSPVSVQTHEVKKALIQQTVFGTGTLEGKTRLAISPQETGAIRQLFADQGDVVKAGTLLVEMDSDDIVQQMKVAEADLEIATASLARIDAEIRSAKANLEYARIAFQRSEKLLQNNAEPRSAFDKIRENMLVATAALEQAEKRRNEAESTLTKYKAQIAYYQTKLSETRLQAPFDALIVRRNREQGAIVNPGVSIMDIVDTSTIWASVWVDETQIAHLQNNLPAEIIFRSLPSQSFQGKICRLWRETDRETREYKVDIALEHLPPNWTLGQRLEAYIKVTAPKQGLVIPANLVSWKNNQPFVLVIENGKIIERVIQIGIRSQNRAEIISGLQEGDRLILQPQKHMNDINRRVKQ